MLERTSISRCLPLALGATTALLLSAGSASAQERVGDEGRSGGRLQGVVFDSTTMRPLPEALVVVMGTAVVGQSDEEGRFRLDGVPPGRHDVFFYHPRLQTLGVSAPPASVELAGDEAAEVTLAVPSEATLLGAWCMAEAMGGDHAPLAGVVRDTLTGVVLPRATVTIRSATPRIGRLPRRLAEGRTDEAGHYRFCNVPTGEPVLAQATFGRSQGLSVRMALRPGEPRIQDLRVTISTVAQLQGVVTEYGTGDPLPGATVELLGTEIRQVANQEGRFVLDSIPPGRQVIRIEHLGFAPRTDSVTVFSNEVVLVEAPLATEPIELEGMVVTARGRLGERLADLGRRRDFLHRAQIETILPRVRDLQDLLEQGDFPGISVREAQLVDPRTGGMYRGLCIESVRMQRSQQTCRMIHVVVDNLPLRNPAEFLSLLPPETVDRIEYLSPMDATTRFGDQGGNGVLVITTRSGGR